MSDAKPRVYVHGASIYVIGTDDTTEACRILGIASNTHTWGATFYGPHVRRQGRWRAASDINTPKDARPGVCFVGRIRPNVEVTA